MTITNNIHAYCSSDEVDFVLSSFGVAARTDDSDEPIVYGFTPASAATYVANAIQKASADINMYLFQAYRVEDISTSGWVKWCAAIMSAIDVCRRRGNGPPQALLEEYQRYLDALKSIQRGDLSLPGDAGLISPEYDMAAGVTNYTVDSRYPAKIRRVQATSTNSPQKAGRKGFNATLPTFWPY